MADVTVAFPEDLLLKLRKTPDDVADEMRRAVAIVWYAQGLISQAKAADLAGMTRPAFLGALAGAGVSPFQETAFEIREASERD